MFYDHKDTDKVLLWSVSAFIANQNYVVLSVFWYHGAVTFTSQFWLWILKFYSVFGEDALVNVSVEKKEDNDGKLAGYIRIRSKTQGIALSLGDRITNVQRGLALTKE